MNPAPIRIHRQAAGVQVKLTALPPLALYVHLPWCLKKCPYCDFNSHQAPAELPQARYLEALVADLDAALPQVWGRRVCSVFIGGGTPSLLGPDRLERLLELFRPHLTPRAEVTVETNPEDVDNAYAGWAASAGVRVSLGVQSFSPELRAVLGRTAQADPAAAFRRLRAAGVANAGLDLIHGIPGQTPELLACDIAAVLALRANGVPGRLVTGYRVSEPLGGSLWLVRERDAHAWAEWQDTAGRWHTLDATPLDYGAAVADYGGGALERAWQRVAARLDAWWQGVVLTDRQVQAVLLAGLAVLAGLFVREYRRLRRAGPQAANSREWQRLWRRFLRVSGLPERPQWTADDYRARLPAAWPASRRAAAERFLELYAALRFAPQATAAEAAAALRRLRWRRLSG